MRLAVVMLSGCMVFGCATSGPNIDVGNDPNLRAVLNGWDRCTTFAALNEASTEKTAEDGADAAMALCRDEEARFAKVLSETKIAPQDAAALEQSERKNMRDQKVALILGWRNR